MQGALFDLLDLCNNGILNTLGNCLFFFPRKSYGQYYWSYRHISAVGAMDGDFAISKSLEVTRCHDTSKEHYTLR